MKFSLKVMIPLVCLYGKLMEICTSEADSSAEKIGTLVTLSTPQIKKTDVVKLCVHFCVCVSKSSRKWTQTDTKVTFHPPTRHQKTFFGLK